MGNKLERMCLLKSNLALSNMNFYFQMLQNQCLKEQKSSCTQCLTLDIAHKSKCSIFWLESHNYFSTLQDDLSGKEVACIKQPNSTMTSGSKEVATANHNHNNNNNNNTSYCWTKRSAHYKALLVTMPVIYIKNKKFSQLHNSNKIK